AQVKRSGGASCHAKSESAMGEPPSRQRTRPASCANPLHRGSTPAPQSAKLPHRGCFASATAGRHRRHFHKPNPAMTTPPSHPLARFAALALLAASPLAASERDELFRSTID